MSTGLNNVYSSSNVQARRFSLLARLNEKIFHASDLAVLWVIKEKNTLYTTLKRYVLAGLLFRIHKGLYSIAPLAQLEPNAVALKILHEYAYITTESALFTHGYLSQKSSIITLVSSRSIRIGVGKGAHSDVNASADASADASAGTILVQSRMLSPKFLMNSVGVIVIDGVRTATAERAIADMLYFRPTFHFDKPVDWLMIKKIQMQIGYPLTPSRYDTATT